MNTSSNIGLSIGPYASAKLSGRGQRKECGNWKQKILCGNIGFTAQHSRSVGTTGRVSATLQPTGRRQESGTGVGGSITTD